MKKFTLDELLKSVTKDNLHPELLVDKPVGKEKL